MTRCKRQTWATAGQGCSAVPDDPTWAFSKAELSAQSVRISLRPCRALPAGSCATLTWASGRVSCIWRICWSSSKGGSPTGGRVRGEKASSMSWRRVGWVTVHIYPGSRCISMPIPSRRLPKPAGGYGERRRQSVFRAIRVCIRGQPAPLSNFPYPNGEQLHGANLFPVSSVVIDHARQLYTDTRNSKSVLHDPCITALPARDQCYATVALLRPSAARCVCRHDGSDLCRRRQR